MLHTHLSRLPTAKARNPHSSALGSKSFIICLHQPFALLPRPLLSPPVRGLWAQLSSRTCLLLHREPSWDPPCPFLNLTPPYTWEKRHGQDGDPPRSLSTSTTSIPVQQSAEGSSQVCLLLCLPI